MEANMEAIIRSPMEATMEANGVHLPPRAEQSPTRRRLFPGSQDPRCHCDRHRQPGRTPLSESGRGEGRLFSRCSARSVSLRSSILYSALSTVMLSSCPRTASGIKHCSITTNKQHG